MPILHARRAVYLLAGESLPSTGLCPGASFESDSRVSSGLSVMQS